MNLKTVIHIIGILLFFEAVSMFAPLAFAFYYQDGDAWAIAASILITMLTGLIFYASTKTKPELRVREGFAIVVFGWATMAAFGALPFVLYGAVPSYTDAFFETMSGFTTTGASILTNIEVLPHGLLFWRSETHWLGGMGIIVLSLAILPFLGVGGMQLFKAEVPGPSPDKLKPRIKETAKILWGVYLVVTFAETLLLMFGGMSLFDALCHTFGTVATGGFSTKNASIAHFDSFYIEGIIILFMLIAGTNFSLHYRALKGEWKSYHKDREFRFYFLFILTCLLITAPIIYFSVNYSVVDSIRSAAFQVVSIVTTTGYATDDFEIWSSSGQFVMLILMFIGGCAGSTGGSIKIIRIMLLLKHGVTEIKKLLHPNAYIPVRLGGRVISPDVITNILAFFILYMLIFVGGSFCMALMGLDLITAIASVAATLGNIGPGLADVGPTDNYAAIPLAGKWLLSLFMLLGRLEIYTVIILFVPEFWKK
ncbi:TrkH family potassium uptake protein [candidate division KSB1 bacterium]|nr:TrkH family potassium uptake protein [candidate division KSB1 bacterium]